MATMPPTCSINAEEWQKVIAADLARLRVFDDASSEELACVAHEAVEDRMPAGTVLVEQSQPFDRFLILLEGRVGISREATGGGVTFRKTVSAAGFFGEVPLLTDDPSFITMRAETDTRGVSISRDGFWRILSSCPTVRRVILTETKRRVQGIHAEHAQQEKLALLGTMTAGLMHELNNPGAAAHRAAQQLRINLQRMHLLSRTFAEQGHNVEQRACLSILQEKALSVRSDACMSSLQQSDAEEEAGDWLDAHAVKNAWELGPVLVSSGIGTGDLECLAHAFPGASLTEPIQWVEATASSMQMVGLVEESVARVSALAAAVKTYVHEGQGGVQDLDVNESVHATLVMLKHKMREKNITLQKQFGPGIPKLHCVCSGLNQVWTNLLDNAIDAAATAGHIVIRTARIDNEVQVVIGDDGNGIPADEQERIFDNFYTTKPAGVGTGMGLAIVQRILQGQGGSLTLESRPGCTEFTVHLPLTGR